MGEVRERERASGEPILTCTEGKNVQQPQCCQVAENFETYLKNGQQKNFRGLDNLAALMHLISKKRISHIDKGPPVYSI
jgi:hypothetical protein